MKDKLKQILAGIAAGCAMGGVFLLAPGEATAAIDPIAEFPAGCGRMEEDESPWFGLLGGDLTEYDGSGVAYYSDGSRTNGCVWIVDV